MRRSRLLPLLALVLLSAMLASVAAGCGGGEDPSDTAGDTSSSSETIDTAAVDADLAGGGRVVIDGLVDYAMTFTPLDMDYMDWRTGVFEHPELGETDYEGVLLSEVLAYVGVQSEATMVTLRGADTSSAEIKLADIPGDAMLAVGSDGALYAVMPGLSADFWIDDVAAINVK